MIMITTVEYALMAGAVYVSTRNIVNQLPAPPGWAPSKYESLDSGFEAVSFKQGSNIVISYAGTGTAVDWLANVGSAFGVTTTQLEQAAEYYLEVKTANPGATISFTGHSLGGGLASLMAVFFNLPAVTFDQAPFANSATVAIATTLRTSLSILGYSDSDLQGLTNFINAPANGGIPNSSQVTDINVQGEV
ncbi:MAG: lipase family protein, partial [Thiobacillaceae bacterium]